MKSRNKPLSDRNPNLPLPQLRKTVKAAPLQPQSVGPAKGPVNLKLRGKKVRQNDDAPEEETQTASTSSVSVLSIQSATDSLSVLSCVVAHFSAANCPGRLGREFIAMMTLVCKRWAAVAGCVRGADKLIKCMLSSEGQKMASRPHFNYMQDVQKSINVRMRLILLDWLLQVHRKFKLRRQVFCLTAEIIDRYLAKAVVVKEKLQLIGAAALLIASKFEEIYAPEAEDLVYISDRYFTKQDLLAMELSILRALDFSISWPTQNKFLSEFLSITPTTDRTITFARLLSDVAAIKYSMLQYAPSLIAAAALRLAQLLTHGEWGIKLILHTSYRESQLLQCMKDLYTGTEEALRGEFLGHGHPLKLTQVLEKYRKPIDEINFGVPITANDFAATAELRLLLQLDMPGKVTSAAPGAAGTTAGNVGGASVNDSMENRTKSAAEAKAAACQAEKVAAAARAEMMKATARVEKAVEALEMAREAVLQAEADAIAKSALARKAEVTAEPVIIIE